MICAANEGGHCNRIKAELLVERIPQQMRKIPDETDQEIAFVTGAEGRFFGGVPIPRDQSLNNCPG